MLHLISTGVLVLIGAGLLMRRRRKVHVRCMVAAFVIDLALVLYIEITLHAVERVAAEMTPLILFHAVISTIVLVLYVVQIVLGRRLLRGIATSPRTHRLVGITFVIMRLTNYVTSFLVGS